MARSLRRRLLEPVLEGRVYPLIGMSVRIAATERTPRKLRMVRLGVVGQGRISSAVSEPGSGRWHCPADLVASVDGDYLPSAAGGRWSGSTRRFHVGSARARARGPRTSIAPQRKASPPTRALRDPSGRTSQDRSPRPPDLLPRRGASRRSQRRHARSAASHGCPAPTAWGSRSGPGPGGGEGGRDRGDSSPSPTAPRPDVRAGVSARPTAIPSAAEPT